MTAPLPTMLTAIQHWYLLARHEDEWVAYETARGQFAGTHQLRAETYRNAARSLRLELETGEAHCACHLLTAAERKQKGVA